MKIPEYKALLKKKPKYRNVKTKVGDITFHSKKEAARYCTLKILEKCGHIEGLILQQAFPLSINGKLICQYIADFVYTQNGKLITEDCKGMKTEIYRLKKKLMFAVHNIEILET